MSVKDVIKKSVLESDMYNQAISAGTIFTMAADLIAAVIMGLLIYEVYKKYYRGVVFSRNYALTLVGMTVLTSMVTLAISTNIVISLGMVGALSIVRYRTAIKEPLDLMYMFWAVTTGITIGASMYILAVAAFIIMLIFIICSGRKKNGGHQYMLVAHYCGEAAGDGIINTKTAATLDFSGVAAFLVTNSLLVQCSIAVLLYFYECRPFHLFPSICDP